MRAHVVICLVLFGLVGATACRPPGYGKGDDGDDAEVDAPKPGDGGTGDGGADAAAATCTKAFRLDGHGTATSVWLTGSFSGWAGNPPAAVVFTLGVDGGWTGSREFAAGLYQYKFIIDGTTWIQDPTNPDSVDDGVGGKNSLYTCVP